MNANITLLEPPKFFLPISAIIFGVIFVLIYFPVSILFPSFTPFINLTVIVFTILSAVSLGMLNTYDGNCTGDDNSCNILKTDNQYILLIPTLCIVGWNIFTIIFNVASGKHSIFSVFSFLGLLCIVGLLYALGSYYYFLQMKECSDDINDEICKQLNQMYTKMIWISLAVVTGINLMFVFPELKRYVQILVILLVVLASYVIGMLDNIKSGCKDPACDSLKSMNLYTLLIPSILYFGYAIFNIIKNQPLVFQIGLVNLLCILLIIYCSVGIYNLNRFPNSCSEEKCQSLKDIYVKILVTAIIVMVLFDAFFFIPQSPGFKLMLKSLKNAPKIDLKSFSFDKSMLEADNTESFDNTKSSLDSTANDILNKFKNKFDRD